MIRSVSNYYYFLSRTAHILYKSIFMYINLQNIFIVINRMHLNKISNNISKKALYIIQ